MATPLANKRASFFRKPAPSPLALSGPHPLRAASDPTATTTTTATTPPVSSNEEKSAGRFSLFRPARASVAIVDAPSSPPSALAVRSASSDTASSSASEEEGRTSSGSDSADDDDGRARALALLEGREPSSAPTTPSPGLTKGVRRERPITEEPEELPPLPASAPPSAYSYGSAGAGLSPMPGSPPASRRNSRQTQQRRLSARILGVGRSRQNTDEASAATTTTAATEDATHDPENERDENEKAVDAHGLPTYATAAFPGHAVTYRFAQAGPFAMRVAAEHVDADPVEGASVGVPALGRYHISVGVNVWAPRSYVTSVRRGLSEDGPLVAQIE